MINSIAPELKTSSSHSFLVVFFMKNNKNSLGASFFLSFAKKITERKDTQLIINIILFHVASMYGKKVRKRKKKYKSWKKKKYKKYVRLQWREESFFHNNNQVIIAMNVCIVVVAIYIYAQRCNCRNLSSVDVVVVMKKKLRNLNVQSLPPFHSITLLQSI